MANNIEPLKFYQEPLYYTGLATLIAFGLVVYSIGNNTFSNLMIPSIIIAFIFGAVTYFMWDTRCPNCKRPFTKIEERDKTEKVNERIETRIHYDKVKYLYSDGNVKSVENGKAHEVNHKIITYRHHYHCKKCGHVWSHDKEVDLDKNTFKPNVTIIRTKEKNPLQTIAENGSKIGQGTFGPSGTPQGQSQEESKVSSLSKYEVEKIIMQRGNKCEYPHCKETVSLEVHHIIARSNKGTNRPSNLIILCPTHHHKADSGSINATRLKLIVSKHINKHKK